MNINKLFILDINAANPCGDTPPDVQSVVWTYLSPGNTPTNYIILADGNGDFLITITDVSHNKTAVGVICNPGDPYLVTVNIIDAAKSGSAIGSDLAGVDVELNGDYQGTFTTGTGSISFMLPTGTNTISISAGYLGLGNPLATYSGTLEVRPLTPP